MKKDTFRIGDLGLIGTQDAMKILEVSHRSNMQMLIMRYKIPHQKLSFGRVFLKADVEAVRDSEIFQYNRDRRQGKNPRKIKNKEISFGGSISIKELDLIDSPTAMKLLTVKHTPQFYLMMERYEIPHKRIARGFVFLRFDIEKVKKSPRRTENLRRRHGK